MGHTHRPHPRTITALSVFLLLTLTAPVWAAEYPLSIEEAVQLARDADLNYQIAELTWENAQIDDTIARAQGAMTAYEQLQHDLSTRQAQNTFLAARNDLALGVVNDYFNLIRAAHDVEIRNRQLTLAENELTRVEQMIAIGNATEQDRLRQVNQVVSAQLSAASAQRTYAAQHSAFVRRLGLAEDVQLVLHDRLEVFPFTYTLDESIAVAREASFDVWQRGVNLQLAEMDLSNLRSQNPAPLALKKSENNFRIQQLNAEQAETQFATQFATQFHSVADAWTQLENAERDYQIAIASYNQTLRQYEAGLRTESEMAQAQIDQLSAEQSILDARTNYAVALMEFELTLGKPLPIGEEALR